MGQHVIHQDLLGNRHWLPIPQNYKRMMYGGLTLAFLAWPEARKPSKVHPYRNLPALQARRRV